MKILKLWIFVAALGLSLSASAQQEQVKGQILDLSGSPLAFAEVKIQNTDISTRADAEGNFSFQLFTGVYDLEVSFIGHETKVLKAVQVSGKDLELADIVLESKRPPMSKALAFKSEED